jgi:hypothetical protein
MGINLENTLSLNNIDSMIEKYKTSLNEMDSIISGNNIIDFFYKIKRDSINKGPYPDVTLFEAANRIMSDLVILFGIKKLLNEEYKAINFAEYHVEYGNSHDSPHDIIAENNDLKLIGEAFNVAPSFFQGKKSMSLAKLRKAKKENTIIVLLYNADAVNKEYRPESMPNEYHIPVEIDKYL